MNLEPTYNSDGSLASVAVVRGPIERSGKSLFAPLFCEHAHDIADPEHGGTGNRAKCGVPITYDGPSQTFQAILHDGPVIAHHDMAAAELRVLARMSELPPDMACEVVRVLPCPSFAPANGDTWPQFHRRVQVTVAAKNGGMTDAEAKVMGQWDCDNSPSNDQLRAEFLRVIRARCIVPSGRVAKRYRARGRW